MNRRSFMELAAAISAGGLTATDTANAEPTVTDASELPGHTPTETIETHFASGHITLPGINGQLNAETLDATLNVSGEPHHENDYVADITMQTEIGEIGVILTPEQATQLTTQITNAVTPDGDTDD